MKLSEQQKPGSRTTCGLGLSYSRSSQRDIKNLAIHQLANWSSDYQEVLMMIIKSF